jgi:two-component system, OmpR family, sensor kinase
VQHMSSKPLLPSSNSKIRLPSLKNEAPEEYIEAIRITNQSVDEMNKIVADILNIGRQEGAQLEIPVQTDIIQILKKWEGDFKLLANSENKTLIPDFEPDAFSAVLQVTLLNQILQNFLQNALKFTPEGKQSFSKLSQRNRNRHRSDR